MQRLLSHGLWSTVFAAFFTTFLVSSVSADDPLDWTYLRGPEMNGISREKGIPDDWDPNGGEGSNLLWKSEELAGRSTPVIMDGKLYLLVRHNAGTPKEQEKVICVDAATGEKKWENIFNVFLSDVPDTRVGWSSVVADPESGNVFALGVCGYFQCLNGETGETIWSHSLSEEFGLLSTYGGRTNFPVVQGNLVIISAIVIGWGEMAKPAHRFIGFDKRNGQTVWFEGTRLLPDDTTYSAPVLTVLNGQDALVFGSGDGGIHAFQPQTGKNIWTYNVSERGINTTPIVIHDGEKSIVICGHSEENIDSTAMGALFALDGNKTGDITKSGEIWRQKEWFIGKSAPLVIDGRVYACEDTGTMIVADAKTGEMITSEKLRGPMRSNPLYVDGKIYLLTENTVWWVFKPTDDGVEVVTRARKSIGGNYGSPVVSHGRMYVPTTDALYCIGNKDQKPEADPQPEPILAEPVESDMKPAQVQVVPVESLLYPGPKDVGQKQQYQVRLFNSRGQYLKTVDPSEVTFTLDGPGSMNEKGEYSTPDEAAHAAVTVTAKVGELTGEARIRLVPELPWSFDFSGGKVPVTWVGARYRHVAIDFDLFEKLNAANPRAAQLYIFLMSDLTNTGAPALKYDDSTPRQQWTGLLRFLSLLTTVKTIDDAKKELDPSLKLLVDEKVIADPTWTATEAIPIQLTVKKGERKIDGNGVMVKITTIPKGTRSQGWMGQPSLSNYTIQADVLGAEKDSKMPDIGLIGQRYTLDMMGASQQLQIRTWPPQLYMAKTVPFGWKSNVWYTMKLRAAVEDGKAVLRGKVWERGTDEPAEWTVEATDDLPNTQGSPGLFGNAKDAEIFYDNIKVSPN